MTIRKEYASAKIDDQKLIICGLSFGNKDFMKTSTPTMTNQHAQGLEALGIDQKLIQQRYQKQHSVFGSMFDGF